MASLEAALVAALKASAGVTTALSGRAFIMGGRQGAQFPYATIQRISTTMADHLDGPANLEWPRMQIDVWDTKPQGALDAADAVELALNAIPLTAAGRSFIATFQDRRGPTIDEETRNFGVSIDFLIWSERA